MTWKGFDKYITDGHWNILPNTETGGFCFFKALEQALYCEHNRSLTLAQMENILIGHLRANSMFYREYHSGNMIRETQEYFDTGQFDSNIVDMLISIAHKAFQLNISIYQLETRTGNTQVLGGYFGPQADWIHLKFTRNDRYPNGNHYEAIVKQATVNPRDQKVEDWLKTIPETPPRNSPGFCGWDNYSPLSTSSKKQETHSQNAIAEDGRDENEGLLDFFFPLYRFKHMEAEWVSQIPSDVNGLKMYKIKTTPKLWKRVSRDLRHFKMRKSSNKDLNGTRKTGDCKGNLFCPNKMCTFKNTNRAKNPNFSQWEGGEGVKTCFSCGTLAVGTGCGARKLTEFDNNTNILTIFHVGIHTCETKLQSVEYDNIATEIVMENMDKGPVMMKLGYVGLATDKGDVKEGRKRANKVETSRLKYLKSVASKDLDPDKHSLEAVGIYKKKVDEDDPFLIYKIHNGNFSSEEPDYVFKTSKEMLQLALEMDNEGPDNPMQDEEAFFDGAHKRCVDFKTLGLFVFHPAMRRILRLASMEVRREDTLNIKWFWKLWNECLEKVSGQEGYKFNPKAIMVDENGANFKAIMEVFSPQFVASRVVSCQLHYKKSVLQEAAKIPSSYQEQFKNICQNMCLVATVEGYNLQKQNLDEFGDKFAVLKNWIRWWHARKYHVFPAFRRFGYCNVTLAESGNSQSKRPDRLWLLDAARDDVRSMVIQVEEYCAFMEQRSPSKGQGPNQITRSANARNEQLRMAREYVEEYSSTRHEQAAREEDRSTTAFMPSATATHKPGRKNGVEGTFKSTKKAPRTTRRKRKNKHVEGMEDNLRQAEQLLLENDDDDDDEPAIATNENVSGPKHNIYDPVTNPPTVAMSFGLPISRCRGCPVPIEKRKEPHDLVFRMKAHYSYRCKRTRLLKYKYGNIYMHLDLTCLQSYCNKPENPRKVLVEDITMDDDTMALLTNGHFKVLKSKRFLKAIVNNKKKEKSFTN